jgi:hypothetical protein
MNGGVGDWLCFSAALLYIAKVHTHVDGYIWAHPPMTDVYRYLFKDIPRWRIHDRVDWEKYMVDGSLVAAPKKGTQLINSCGSHLVDLGFTYYCNYSRPPEGHDVLPLIDYEVPWKWPELDPQTQYAIFTPGATSQARTMKAEYFNELVAYTKSLGIVPVFMGKKVVMGEYVANFEEGYDFSQGIDLREKTTLLEATQIMRGAVFVLGLDNGLLHLAGCTDTPVIFGHNVATIAHRRLKRQRGLTVDITVPKKKLGCIGCQSEIRFTKHNFTKCIHGDYLCLDMLFRDNCEVWKRAIHMIVKGNFNASRNLLRGTPEWLELS